MFKSWIVLFVHEELILICWKIINELESSLKYCSSTIALFIYFKHVYGSWFKRVSDYFQP